MWPKPLLTGSLPSALRSPRPDLARSHVGDEQFRPLLRHAGRDDAAPEMAEQDQWRARKALVQLFGEIDPVGDELLARDAGRAVLRERSPRPTLVPLHENKVLLVRCVSRDQRRLNVARPAVQEEQYWISAVVATYGDPLLNPANRHERGFFDALPGSLCVDRSGNKKQNDERRGG